MSHFQSAHLCDHDGTQLQVLSLTERVMLGKDPLHDFPYQPVVSAELRTSVLQLG